MYRAETRGEEAGVIRLPVNKGDLPPSDFKVLGCQTEGQRKSFETLKDSRLTARACTVAK